MPGVCRGSLELYSAAIAAQNLASRSRNRPAKTSFPETSARGASTPAGPSSPRQLLSADGGFVVLGLRYTLAHEQISRCGNHLGACRFAHFGPISSTLRCHIWHLATLKRFISGPFWCHIWNLQFPQKKTGYLDHAACGISGACTASYDRSGASAPVPAQRYVAQPSKMP